MKAKNSFWTLLFNGTVLAYILLFTYAATSKIIDFENFQIQLAQSPLLSAYAGVVSYGIIIAELVIAGMLLSKRTQFYGLYAGLFLMTAFTAYIYIILNFSSFIPCSCGGVLENMGWTEHIIFNLFFVLLISIAILLHSKTATTIVSMIAIKIIGISSVIAIFLASEDMMHHRNNFVRRYPDKTRKSHDLDIDFNSYYFAGASHGKIYLGNYTAPLLLTEIDTALKAKSEIAIQIDDMTLPFRSLQLTVQEDIFFAFDGTIPCLFLGKTENWKARKTPLKSKPFAAPTVIDTNTIAYRTHNLKSESVLGISKFGSQDTTWTNPNLIQKQIDGIFDADGVLLYDAVLEKIVYLYRYRNQFIVADKNLNLDYRGKTIDTVEKAQIKIVHDKEKNETKLGAPPLSVNKLAALSRGLLFVNSGLLGQYEDAKVWNQTSVVDVYDIQTNTYLESFYIYNIDRNKMNKILVYDDCFYALLGSHLVSYKLSPAIVSKLRNIQQ